MPNSYNLVIYILNIIVIVVYTSLNSTFRLSVKVVYYSVERNKISIRIEKQFRFEFLKKTLIRIFLDSNFFKKYRFGLEFESKFFFRFYQFSIRIRIHSSGFKPKSTLYDIAQYIMKATK